MPSIITGRQHGGFVKGWFWRTCPVPLFVPGEYENVPLFRFSFRGKIRMYPCSGFRSGGASAKTPLLETTLLSTPEIIGLWGFQPYSRGKFQEKPWECFRVFSEFLPGSPSRIGGKACLGLSTDEILWAKSALQVPKYNIAGTKLTCQMSQGQLEKTISYWDTSVVWCHVSDKLWALDRCAAYSNFKDKNGPEKWTPKRANNLFVGTSLNLLCFPPKKRKSVASAKQVEKETLRAGSI